jgi:DNA helicase-2/ATP-dependent DNA helicase PcrA
MMDLLADLNGPQRQAVQHVDGPLIVLAGAGSGKTRVITRRVAHLIREGIAPWNILALTFTNKAAGEMRERIFALAGACGVTVCTFHALSARLMREFAPHLGIDPNYSIYDRDDQVRLMKQAMGQASLSTDGLSPTAVLGTISNAKNDLQGVEAFSARAGDFYSRNVAKAYAEYQRLLAANNAMDFDDLLVKTATLLRDRPDLRQFLGQRYRYVLIDEYQDTNRAQYIIAHGIAMEHGNICATGDPDQSIYAWRGADIRNIMEFEQDYPDALVVNLEENYRSTAPILTAASALIAHNTERKDKRLWTSREGGGKVRVAYYDDEHAEAAAIADEIQDRLASGQADHDDIALFYRVNSLSRVLEEAMLVRGIPYRIARGVEFFNRKEIRDVLAYLRLIVNRDDDLSCARIINMPSRKIGTTTVNRLRAYADARGMSLLEACRYGREAGLPAAAAGKAGVFAELIDSLSEHAAGSVKDAIEQVVQDSGLEEMVRHGGEEQQQAWANIEELISTGAEFDARQSELAAVDLEGPAEDLVETGLSGYLHQVSLVSDSDHLEGSGAVTLMTLHAAKGLEFPVVYMVGCEMGLLPFERASDSPFSSGGNDAKLEEERRLAFVGMTRAKEQLVMTCVKRRMVRGRRMPQAASPFLTEIGTEGVAVEDHTTLVDIPRRSQAIRGGFFDRSAENDFLGASTERAMIEAIADTVYDEADMDNPPPPEYEHLRVGAMVQHPKFGMGKVAKLSQPWPRTKAVVDFHAVGRKTIVLSMARLELCD